MFKYILYLLFFIRATCFCCESPSFSVNNDESLKCDVLTSIDSGQVCGRVRTAEEHVKYASFRGIPYAQQPLAELRFKELQPLDPWNHTLIATEEGPICPQYDEVYGRLARPIGMSEACIFANVHVPLKGYDSESNELCQETGLPIMVFIHGGGFQTGSGNSDLHGPEYLVSKGVIVITFNYRINVFGYLSLNSSSIPGNNGLRDVITLLQWVQRNARAFGGDPENVTLGGQSCGSVAAHLVSLSTASAGLMKRILLMSGVGNAGFFTASPAYAQTVSTMFLTQLGINSTDADEIHAQLIQMPLEKIMEANRLIQFNTGLVSFVPVVESEHPNVTRILDDYPANLVRQGRGNLPTILGTTSKEGVYFERRIRYLNILGRIKDDPTIILPLNITFSVSETEALKLSEVVENKYFQGNPTVEKFIELCTNSYFVYPAFKLAMWRASLNQAPVYMYKFMFDSDYNIVKNALMLNYKGGSAHVEDQTFMFRVNSMMDPDEKSFPPRTRDDLMKHWMTTYMINFMKCSQPLCLEQSAWPPVDEERLNYQLLNEPLFLSNINITDEQRDMFQFYDNIFAAAGSSIQAST